MSNTMGFQELLDGVVAIASSSYVAVVANWLQILDSKSLEKARSFITSLLPAGNESPFIQINDRVEVNKNRKDDLVALLNNPEVLPGIAFLWAGSDEIRFLKAFHGLRPTMYIYIEAIQRHLKEVGSGLKTEAGVHELACLISEDMKNQASGDRLSVPPTFSDCIFKFQNDGYEPLIRYLKNLDKNESELFDRLRNWHGAYYKTPKEWTDDISRVKTILAHVKSNQIARLEGKLEDVARFQLKEYVQERSQFLFEAFTFSARLFMAYRYLGLSQSEPMPSKDDNYAYTEVGAIAKIVNTQTVDLLINRSNKLIFRTLDFVVDSGQWCQSKN